MRAVICAKEVPDPDAVNAYAVGGRLTIGPDGKTLAQSGIPRLMNAYDEQAIEAALRLRDAGAELTITVVTVGEADTAHYRRAAALGADELINILAGTDELDTLAIGAILSAYIRQSGGAELVLCGRQASDDDQGVVPAVIGELLGLPVVTMARDVRLRDGGRIQVTRVTPDGDEVVSCALPAVVTVSNELGTPRYPTAAATMAARRKRPVTMTPSELGLSQEALAPHVSLRRMFVPAMQGNCEFLSGEGPHELALALLRRLREDGLVA